MYQFVEELTDEKLGKFSSGELSDQDLEFVAAGKGGRNTRGGDFNTNNRRSNSRNSSFFGRMFGNFFGGFSGGSRSNSFRGSSS